MTKLLYVDDMCKLNCKAHIIEVRQDADATALILDQTVFYPQGGGQPADKGIAQNDTTQFQVQGVSKDGEQVLHKGVLVPLKERAFRRIKSARTRESTSHVV